MVKFGFCLIWAAAAAAMTSLVPKHMEADIEQERRREEEEEEDGDVQ